MQAGSRVQVVLQRHSRHHPVQHDTTVPPLQIMGTPQVWLQATPPPLHHQRNVQSTSQSHLLLQPLSHNYSLLRFSWLKTQQGGDVTGTNFFWLFMTHPTTFLLPDRWLSRHVEVWLCLTPYEPDHMTTWLTLYDFTSLYINLIMMRTAP